MTERTVYTLGAALQPTSLAVTVWKEGFPSRGAESASVLAVVLMLGPEPSAPEPAFSEGAP